MKNTGEFIVISIGVVVISWLIFSMYYFDGKKHIDSPVEQKEEIKVQHELPEKQIVLTEKAITCFPVQQCCIDEEKLVCTFKQTGN